MTLVCKGMNMIELRQDTLLHSAFSALFPRQDIPQLRVKFSGHFKEFNGNVTIRKERGKITALEFSLSKKFLDAEQEIITGIVQHLLNKVYKTSHKTIEQELYHHFIKHLTRYAARQKSDSLLIELFHELNKEYFNDLLEEPNMIFGNDSTTTLGHYSYAKDLVTVSTVLKADRELLKYVLYHELLHKKHSFKQSGNRTMYHTKAFKDDEKRFHDNDIERKLEKFIRKKKIKRMKLW